MNLTVTLSHDPAELEHLREAWTALQDNSAAGSIFVTWDWMATWWKYFGREAELWLLQARDGDGRLVGLGPLMLAPHRPIRGTSWRQLQFIAATAPGDHLDFIIEREREAEVIAAFMDKIRQERRRWDVLYLSSMPEYSTTLEPLKTSGIPWQIEETFNCPYIALPGDWETFYQSLSKRKRKNTRHKQNKMDKVYPGAWTCETLDDPAALDNLLDTMIRHHQAKWHALGAPGGFPDQRTIDFHHDFAHRLLEQNRLKLFGLRVEGNIVAIEYGFQYRDRHYALASGFDDHYADLSPGQVLMQFMIQEAITAGLKEFDFLRGEEAYKFFWQAANRSDFTLRWVASPRARLIDGFIGVARASWRVGKRFLPQAWRQRLRQTVKDTGSLPEEDDD